MEEPLLPESKCSLRFKFHHFAVLTVGLPFSAFLFCVYWSVTYQFRESTATHCQVDNYLPSISAAIGRSAPQKTVWTAFIVLHFWPRVKIAGRYFKHLKDILHPRAFRLVWINWLLNVLEVTSLLGLSVISSTDYYPVHVFFFSTFLITSLMYMALSCRLLKSHRSSPPSNTEQRSYRLKLRLAIANLVGLLMAGYCFVRHNSYCEPGMYSLFALLEYVVVLSNMGFHMTAYFDFYGHFVRLTLTGIHFRPT